MARPVALTVAVLIAGSALVSATCGKEGFPPCGDPVLAGCASNLTVDKLGYCWSTALDYCAVVELGDGSRLLYTAVPAVGKSCEDGLDDPGIDPGVLAAVACGGECEIHCPWNVAINMEPKTKCGPGLLDVAINIDSTLREKYSSVLIDEYDRPGVCMDAEQYSALYSAAWLLGKDVGNMLNLETCEMWKAAKEGYLHRLSQLSRAEETRRLAIIAEGNDALGGGSTLASPFGVSWMKKTVLHSAGGAAAEAPPPAVGGGSTSGTAGDGSAAGAPAPGGEGNNGTAPTKGMVSESSSLGAASSSFMESLTIYGLVMALVLLSANPLIK